MSSVAASQRIRLGKRTNSKLLLWVIAGLVLMVAIAISALRILAVPTQHYWVVTKDVPANASLADVELRPVSLDLGTSESAYLASAQRPEGYASRAITAGEILSATAFAATANQDVSRLALELSTAISSNLRAGSIVEIWAAQKLGTDFAPVELLVPQAQVVNLAEAGTHFESENPKVEVEVDQLSLPAVLDAVATGSAIYLVAAS